LSTRRYHRRLTTYYTLLNGPTPKHIVEYMPEPVSATTHYNLRNRDDQRIPQRILHTSLNSFFPKTTRDWNSLPVQTRASNSKCSFKRAISNKKHTNPYINTHHGRCGAWISRIRMGLSGLNAHRFTYNLIDSPICPNCPNENETIIHFMWHCKAYESEHKHMIDRILS
jgi:hypothetical protein